MPKKLFAFLTVIALAGCGADAPAEPAAPAETPARVVETRAAGAVLDGVEITALGDTEAARTAAILARATGRIASFDKKIGDRVEAGELLGRIEPDGRATPEIAQKNAEDALRATETASQKSIAAAEAEVASAETSRASAWQSLRNARAQILTAEENARAAVDSAETSLDSAETALENARSQADLDAKSARENLTRALDDLGDRIPDWLASFDRVLGIEEATKHENDDFESYLGATDRDALRRAEDGYRTLRDQRDDFLDEKSLAAAEVFLPAARAEAGLVIRALDTALLDADKFSKTDRDALRTEVAATKTAIETARATLENLDQTLDATLRASATAIDAAESAKNSAQKSRAAAETALAQTLAQNKTSLESAENALKSAEAGLTSARAALERARATAAQSEISAQGSLDLASKSFQNLEIRAEIAGTLTEKNLDPGAAVSAGERIGAIAGGEFFKITARVAPGDAARIRVGDRATVGGAPAEVTAVGTDAGPDKNIPIELRAAAGAGLAGGTISLVKFTIPRAGGELWLPFSLVRFDDENPAVLAVSGSVAATKKITLGTIRGDAVQILSGIDAETPVILTPGIFPGDRIE